jgi:AraC-like DNA-binding protein
MSRNRFDNLTSSAMRFWKYRPGPPLADFVDLFWYYEDYAPPHREESVLPMATTELVIHVDGSHRCPVVSGPHSKPFVLNTSQPASMVGVHFKPGGAFAFLNGSMAGLHNAHATLESLWGRKSAEVQDRLMACRTPDGKFRILEQALVKTARNTLARHAAIEFALNEFTASEQVPTVAYVTERVGLRPKRFINLFTQQVGVTPKLFCRIERFQRVLRRLESITRPDWVDLALTIGYYDQAHFNNEFRSFAGLTPTVYMQRRGAHFNHVPLAE